MKATTVHSKTAGAGAAGALSVIAVWAASEAGANIPPEVSSAFTTLLAAAGAWLPRPKWLNKGGE